MKYICLFITLLLSPWMYSQNIQSLSLATNKNQQEIPILNLNSGQKLWLSFDDLDDAQTEYGYEIIHCNPDGTPSKLQSFEYINGFASNSIDKIDLSFNTLISYTHYSTEIPSSYQKITKSGKYQVRIYPQTSPSQTIASLYFFVLDNHLTINAKTKIPDRIEYRLFKQQIEMEINSKISIIQPYQNLKVYIQQNNNPLTIKQIKDGVVSDKSFYYTINDSLIFDGFNEFRTFDIRSTQSGGRNVEAIYKENRTYNAYLYNESPRMHKVYLTHDDLNGHFVIKADKTDFSEIEGEYVNVHFSLESQALYKDVYVVGDFNQWKLNPNYRMTYDPNSLTYKLSHLFKQGFYDYCYMAVSANSKIAPFPLEGNFQETENDYHIFVYYKRPGNLHEELIGYTKINSSK